MVYILNMEGKPLMPTVRHGKVRHLLKDKKAKVVMRDPFTIQLLYETTEYTQPITLGVDAGSKHIGISASTEKKELYAAEEILRADVSESIQTRAQARRFRRYRKTRYRQARFQNRKQSKPKGWVAPSIRHKLDCHLERIAFVHSILPVTKTIVEVASFDTQKLKDPDISGVEYQQGEQLGFWNVREYVLFRDGHECQHCHGKSKDPVLTVHHLESRKTGGDSPGNLITLCESCHKEYHSLSPEEQKKWKLPKRTEPYRDAAFMGIMRWSLYEQLQEEYGAENVSITYGYITKNTRIRLGLEKSHVNDAFCIAGNLEAKPLETMLVEKKVRRHNRQIHRFNTITGGKRKLNQAPWQVHGFRLFDKVFFQGQECFIFGRRKSGYFLLKKLDGTRVHASAKAKELKLIEESRGYIKERRERQFLPTLHAV